jgi:hypothetical protein
VKRLLATDIWITAVLCLALAGCSVWGPEGGPDGSGLRGPTASAQPPVDAVAGPDGVQRVEISAGDDLRFTPPVIRAHPGVIEFVFHNVGSTPHGASVLHRKFVRYVYDAGYAEDWPPEGGVDAY